MPCTITPNKFACGGMNVLLEAVFEDNQIWICRIGYLQSKYGAKFLEKMIHTTVTAMRYVSQHTTIKVPEVYAYEGNIEKARSVQCICYSNQFMGFHLQTCSICPIFNLTRSVSTLRSHPS